MSEYERIARAFHGVYETLAPEHGYESRPESRVPWAEVPEKNRALMVGTVRRLVETGVVSSTQQQSGQLQELLEWLRAEIDGSEELVAAARKDEDVIGATVHREGAIAYRVVVRRVEAALASINQKGGE
jgi:hypothetical protein